MTLHSKRNLVGGIKAKDLKTETLFWIVQVGPKRELGGRRRNQRDVMIEEEAGEIQRTGRTWHTIAGFKDRGRRPWTKECRWLLRNWEQLSADSQEGSKTSVLHLQRLNSANNLNEAGNRSSPTASRGEHSLPDTLMLAWVPGQTSDLQTCMIIICVVLSQ